MAKEEKDEYRKIWEKEFEKQTLAFDTAETGMELLQDAIKSAKQTFRNIIIMSNITFSLGIIFLVVSAISSLVLRLEISFVFGGLGGTSFVAFFISRPINSVQNAISNLMQAEVALITYFDQLHFWAPFASSDDFKQRKIASQKLQDITSSTMQLLERYLEKKIPDELTSKQESD